MDFTVGISFKIKKLEEHGHRLQIRLWDTMGRPATHDSTYIYVRRAHIVFVVYDVSNRRTFDEAVRWLQWAADRDNSCSGMIGIMANKIDMVEKRVISAEEGRRLAMEYAAPDFEVSAKWGVNIDVALTTMAFYYVRTRGLEAKQMEPSSRAVGKARCLIA